MGGVPPREWPLGFTIVLNPWYIHAKDKIEARIVLCLARKLYILAVVGKSRRNGMAAAHGTAFDPEKPNTAETNYSKWRLFGMRFYS